MKEAYEIAQRNATKAAGRSKQYYDRRVSGGVLQPRDRVLVRNLTERGGPGKLRPHWEEVIHVVVERMGVDSPVYRIKPENGHGRVRVLHRNLRLPCDALELESSAGEPVSQTKRAAASSSPQPKTSGGLSSEEESDDLTGMGLVTYSQETTSSSPSSQGKIELPESDEISSSIEADTSSSSENEPVAELSPDRDVIPEEPLAGTSPEQNVSTRPQRQCRPPQTLTYSSLGYPEYQRFNSTVNCVQVPWMLPPVATAPPQGPLYYWILPMMPALPPIYC